MSIPADQMGNITGGGSVVADPGALAALAGGIQAADAARQGSDEPDPKETADVTSWWRKINEARDFDAPARKQYAKDRKYARGDSGFPVDTNLIGTFIDILQAHLYARDPTVEAQPATAVEPPSLDAIKDAAMAQVANDPRVAEAAQGAKAMAIHQNAMMAQSNIGQQALAAGMAPGPGPGGTGGAPMPNPSAMLDPNVAANAAAKTKQEELAVEQYQQMRMAYEKQQRQNKAFADTLDIVVQRLWFDARLKARGKRVTRSGLTVGPGWLKASWQTRTGMDPETMKAMNDIRAMMDRAAASKVEIEDGGGVGGGPAGQDAMVAEYERQLKALSAKAEITLARGFVVDFVEVENMIVPQDCGPLSECMDSPWMADQSFIRKSEAAAKFGLKPKEIGRAVAYYERPPVMHQNESATQARDIDAQDAERFTSAMPSTGSMSSSMNGDSAVTGGVNNSDKDYFVRQVEIWDRESDSVLTTIEGVKKWAKKPWNPKTTTRWYPYFLYAMSEVDGQRHPQSMTSRLTKLADEYNSVRTGYKEHRQRARPKTWFNAGMVDPDTATRLANGTTAEWIPVRPTVPGTPLSEMMGNVAYPAVDVLLYETKTIIAEMERVSGVQEAQSQAIQVPKTATEANIEQNGFNTRTASMQDNLDDMLTELALYTSEVALQNMTTQDVQAIAGPDAFWIEALNPDELRSLVDVRIKAGSSGKPNIAQDRQVWAQIYPLLSQDIQLVAKLRNSDPEEIAQRIEELVRQTFVFADMAGSTDRFIPRPGPAPVGPPPIGPVEQSEIHMNDCIAMNNVSQAIKNVPGMAMQPKLGDPDSPPPDPNGPVGVLVKSMMANEAATAQAKTQDSQAKTVTAQAKTQDAPTKIMVAQINAESKVRAAKAKPAPKPQEKL